MVKMQCKNCINETICKFTNSTIDAQKSVGEIPILTNSPITITVECKSYRTNINYRGINCMDSIASKAITSEGR